MKIFSVFLLFIISAAVGYLFGDKALNWLFGEKGLESPPVMPPVMHPFPEFLRPKLGEITPELYAIMRQMHAAQIKGDQVEIERLRELYLKTEAEDLERSPKVE